MEPTKFPRADLRALPPEHAGRPHLPVRDKGSTAPRPRTGAAPVAGGRGSLVRRILALAALAICCVLLVPSIVSARPEPFPPTTTEVTTSTSSSTTTTVAPTTSSTPTSTTSPAATTTEPPTTSTTSAPTSTSTTSPTTTLPATSSVPTTAAASTSTTPAPATTAPPTTFALIPPATGCQDRPSTPQNDCDAPTLPATGSTVWYFVGLGALCVLLGALAWRWNRSGR